MLLGASPGQEPQPSICPYVALSLSLTSISLHALHLTFSIYFFGFRKTYRLYQIRRCLTCGCHAPMTLWEILTLQNHFLKCSGFQERWLKGLQMTVSLAS